MPGQFEARIGKPVPESIAELEALLVGQEEDENLEAKTIPRGPEAKHLQDLEPRDRHIVLAWEVEELAVSATVGFLNKEDGTGGVVVLGADAPKGRIEVLRPITLARLGKLEAALQSKIGTSSVPHTRPEISVTRVPRNGEPVVGIVEVVPKDRTTLYYSRISNQAYRRDGGDTRTLPLSESIQLVEGKRRACVSVQLIDGQTEEKTPGTDLVGRFRFVNAGNVPGKYVTALLIVSGDVDPNAVGLTGQGVADVSAMNKGQLRAFQVVAGYPPSTMYVYPRMGSVFADLRVHGMPDAKILRFDIQVYEDRGSVQQVITISRSGNNITVNHSEPEVVPY